MFQWCFSIFSYTKLLYQLNCYYNSYAVTQTHDVILLNNIIESVKNCGSVMIKFCQWITPKLELIYIEENVESNTDNKPIWLVNLESLYEDCDYHDIQYTYDKYQNVFHQSFTDKYIVLDLLGSGSIGQVYLIEDKKKNQFVMKILHPNVTSDILFFKTMYSLLYCIPCFKNKIMNLFPVDVHEFINAFEEQSNFITESNNLLKFHNEYKNNDYIIIPTLYQCSESILIMSYEKGVPFDEIEVNNYQKFKLVNLLNLFIRNNWTITNFNHGDLHKGNWKVSIDTNTREHKLIFYDFGFCFKLMEEKFYIIEIMIETFESADKDTSELYVTNLCNLIWGMTVYPRNDIGDYKSRIKDYIVTNIDVFRIDTFTPLSLLKLITPFCINEKIYINHILLQFFIISIQCQSLLDKFGFKSSDTNYINSYTVFRERYLDVITYCKTYEIFNEYSNYLEDKLNVINPEVTDIFDTIEFDDEFKKLALDCS